MSRRPRILPRFATSTVGASAVLLLGTSGLTASGLAGTELTRTDLARTDLAREGAAFGLRTDGGVEIGSPAPGLELETWVAGREVAGFDLGRVYVVSFFCADCVECAAELPNLAHVQSRGREAGLVVLGVTGSDSTVTSAAGARMAFDALRPTPGIPIAFDAGRATRDAWLGPESGQEVPRVFLVDSRGDVVFRGEPQWLALPLEGVLAGNFEPERGNAEVERAKATFQRIAESASSDPVAAVAAFDAFVAEFPAYADTAGPARLTALLDAAASDSGLLERAFELGSILCERSTNRGDFHSLDRIAFALVDPARELPQRDLDLAQRAAERAEQITAGRHPAVLDTLARVHHARGDFERAVQVQQRAIDAAGARDAAFAEQLQQRLDEYRAAAAAAALDGERADENEDRSPAVSIGGGEAPESPRMP